MLAQNNYPQSVSCILNGDAVLGHKLCQDVRIPLISATGSARMGRSIGVTVAERFGKSILELGGNNAVIISETADLKKYCQPLCLVQLEQPVSDVLLPED